jgi:hypothetical protein
MLGELSEIREEGRSRNCYIGHGHHLISETLPVAADIGDRRFQTKSFLRLRLFTCMLLVHPLPPVACPTVAGWTTSSERLNMALLPGCPPPTPTTANPR